MAPPQLERYEIIGELGQGGMSVVYRARDRQLSREVALKVLHEFLARQEDARRRFHREAVAVAKLRDPGILEIFDYSGPDAAQSFIVTELIEGRTLRELIEKSGTPAHPELGALIVAELARALRHAHEQGVVHRDIKPENIMITHTGQLKLMDFGIAQIMGGATKLTATGTLLGSPAHMAPEVIDGKPSDHRSDIFSVGTILYWLSAGQLPFAAPNPSALFRLILEGRYPHPQEIAPKIGNGLAKIIEHSLEANPEARYQDISELQADLKKELELVGLDHPESMVKRYLSDPPAFSAELRPKLIETLTSAGRAALAEKNVGRAMDRFNRVLAIDPEHKEVRALVARVGRRRKLVEGSKRTGAALLGLLLTAGTSYAGLRLYEEGVFSPTAPPPPPPVLSSLPKDALAEAERGPPGSVSDGASNVDRPPPSMSVEPDPVAPPPPRRIDRNNRRGSGGPKPSLDSTPPPSSPTPPPVIEAAPAKKVAQLKLTITHAYADVLLDGALKSRKYGGLLELEPGHHTVELRRPELGMRRVIIFEVTPEGELSIDEGNGLRRLTSGELRVRAPVDKQSAAPEGWTSS